MDEIIEQLPLKVENYTLRISYSHYEHKFYIGYGYTHRVHEKIMLLWVDVGSSHNETDYLCMFMSYESYLKPAQKTLAFLKDEKLLDDYC